MNHLKSTWSGFTGRFVVIFSIVICGFANCSENDPAAPIVKQTPQDSVIVEQPVIVPTIAPTVCDFDLDDAKLTAAGWTKTFEDGFDTDLSKWNIWRGGAFNNELELYQASNLAVADGKLHIMAKKDTVTGATNPYDNTQKTFHFTSGRIECKTSISASPSTPKVRIIARIKLPAGEGLWPAFWSYGDPWPTKGEIDFIEARGSAPKKYQTNYFYGSSANSNVVHGAEGFIEADADLTTCYHVYEMIWEQNKLTSVLDGTIVEVKKSGDHTADMFGKDQHVTLDLAVGGLFFSNLDPKKIEEGEMIVDWVKVFTSN
jgi:beta-glucanase (GH16 family)